MARLIDADALLEVLHGERGADALDFNPVMFIKVKRIVDDAPTIDAIPVGWLKTQINEALDDNETELASDIDWLIRKYKNEQEGQREAD